MKANSYTGAGTGGRPARPRRNAAEMLGPAARSKNVACLIGALACKDVQKRWRARRGLVVIGRPAVGPLLDALRDRRQMVRWEAAKALSEIADSSAAAAMVTALEDEDAGIRWLAAEGLIALGRGGVAPLFQALIERSDSKWLQEGAHHVLHTFVRRKWGSMVEPVLVAMRGPAPEAGVPLAAEAALHALKGS